MSDILKISEILEISEILQISEMLEVSEIVEISEKRQRHVNKEIKARYPSLSVSQ